MAFLVIFVAFYLLNQVQTDSNEKIVNGIIATRGRFPYHAALLQKPKNQRDLFLCGGSVISPKVILTAAHCLWNVERGVLILGAFDLIANETGVKRFVLDEENFKTHPNFNFAYAFMDVGVIKLPESIEYNEFVKPVELPSKFQFEETFAGDIGITAGYGRYCDTCGSSSVLRYAMNRIISTDECSNFTGLFPTKTQICVSTAENKSSACRGDSGGALTVVRSNVTIQVGISSFGAQKCEEGQPAVFTRLTKEIVEWINEELEEAN